MWGRHSWDGEPGITVVSREIERQGGVVNVVGALLLIGRIRRTPVLVPAAQPVYSTTPRTRTQIRSGFISVHVSTIISVTCCFFTRPTKHVAVVLE